MAIEPVASVRTREYDLLRVMLREARESTGVSQEELSRRLGRPITYIGKIELGSRRLDLVELAEICDTLGIPPERLVADWRESLRRGIVSSG